MPKASIDYMNARRRLLPASGGAKQDCSRHDLPDRDLDACDRLELQTDSAWSDYRIRSQAMLTKTYNRLAPYSGLILADLWIAFVSVDAAIIVALIGLAYLGAHSIFSNEP